MAKLSEGKKRQVSPDNLTSKPDAKKQKKSSASASSCSEDLAKQEIALDAEKDAEKRATPKAWTETEKLALERGKVKLGLLNTSFLQQEPGLEDRNTAQINMKLRGDAKKYEKAHGGDPKWVDKFKLLGGVKEK